MSQLMGGGLNAIFEIKLKAEAVKWVKELEACVVNRLLQCEEKK